MKRTKRWVLGIVGVASLLFGLGCINYTKADGLDHHREVARRHGLPLPSRAILLGGVGAISLARVADTTVALALNP